MVTDAAGLASFAMRFVTHVRIGNAPESEASRRRLRRIGDAPEAEASSAPAPRSADPPHPSEAPPSARSVGDVPDSIASSVLPLHASMTLLQLPDRRVGVTCQHVLAAYRERRVRDSAWAFQVGGVTLDPEERLLAEERLLDLAILDLEGLEGVAAGALPGSGRAAGFFEPDAWPLGSAEAGELVGLGGYGVTRVIDAGAENIACEIARASGASPAGTLASGTVTAGTPPGAVPSAALVALGGLSGGPGFVQRESGIHLAGVVFAAARSGAYLRLRPARFIRRDGTLLPRGTV